MRAFYNSGDDFVKLVSLPYADLAHPLIVSYTLKSTKGWYQRTASDVAIAFKEQKLRFWLVGDLGSVETISLDEIEDLEIRQGPIVGAATDPRIATEDHVRQLVDGLDEAGRLICYRYLYTLDYRITGIDTAITKACRARST